MSLELFILIIPPALWCLIWLISLINQVTTLGEVNTDIQTLEIVGRAQIDDWDILMRTARWNLFRTRLKVSFAALIFLGGLIAEGALLANVPLLHSILNLAVSVVFFIAALLFLRLSYLDRSIYRIGAGARVRDVTQRGGVA